ncbi:DNA primase/polymerase [Arthrobacter phage Bridgette]|uniref:DNA primase/polymerase n=1 Tax=Arthrobacter phage Bridgette TaxID=2419949 RepID=A0A3G2KED2_9CAUD|nr:DNA polymerase/primase [Arthrobacter phage Bridgette]AYN57327.1 DNA primase/polymerase [Arthrobacter phage Bridgette]
MSTLEAAKELAAAGLSVVPVMTDGTKRPDGGWKEYQTLRASTTKLHEWFAQGSLGIGVVTGTISGNLELTEVEGRGADRLPEIAQLATDTGLGDLWARLCAGWLEQSPSGGWHWFYKISYPEGFKFPGNTKIAKAANKETVAETRAQGGYVIVAPSAGTVHPSGKPWVRVAGGPSTIPTITPDEREAFHALLGTLNEYTPEVTQQAFSVTTPQRDPLEGTTPGDDFENKTTWSDILQPAGWTKLFTSGRTTYWRRPGKTIGMSATTGNAEDRDRLYVFTSSTEFEQEVPYTKFGAYALLHHRGDHAAAASELRKKGHGSEPQRPVRVPLPGKLHSVPASAPAAPASTASSNTPTTPTATAGTAALATVHDIDDHRAPSVTLQRSDDGNAQALIDQYGDRLRYCSERGRWLAWNGNVWEWQHGTGGAAREYAKAIARALPDSGTEAQNHKRRALSAKGTSDMLIQAQTDPRITVTMDQLDAHPWELNTPGGIIDLRTGQLTPPDPTKLHTRITACAPDFDADTTLWQTFLNQTFPEGEGLIAYMQRLVGYSAIGEVREHLLPFAYGGGGNGKGVFLEAIKGVLGDYATTSPNGFLMASNYAPHTTEIARLAGQRMVICSEVNEDDKFDEAKVKALAGGDTLTARFMRQDDFTFKPTHQLWLMGNHQPAVESGGHSFWRRLRLIPFTHTVPDSQMIEDLQGILARDHGPAVLAWIARGAAEYAAKGLQEPAGVKAATEDYAHSVDTVGRFIEEECTLHPGTAAAHLATDVSAIRAAYERWCLDNGETALRGRAFQSQIRRHGVLTGAQAPRGTGGARRYGGITLLSAQTEQDDHDGDRGGW